jgi:hypothetical protein
MAAGGLTKNCPFIAASLHNSRVMKREQAKTRHARSPKSAATTTLAASKTNKSLPTTNTIGCSTDCRGWRKFFQSRHD